MSVFKFILESASGVKTSAYALRSAVRSLREAVGFLFCFFSSLPRTPVMAGGVAAGVKLRTCDTRQAGPGRPARGPEPKARRTQYHLAGRGRAGPTHCAKKSRWRLAAPSSPTCRTATTAGRGQAALLHFAPRNKGIYRYRRVAAALSKSFRGPRGRGVRRQA